MDVAWHREAALVTWNQPSPFPTLTEDAVHLWRIPLDTPPVHVAALLSSEERQRADSFRFTRHRDRFITAHGMLRRLLAAYLHIEPTQLRFQYGEHGKPALAGMHFNLSRSADFAVLGVARTWPLGVDLEYLRDDLDFHSIAARMLSPTQVMLLNHCAPDVLPQAFYACWTQHEAYVKALGCGLTGIPPQPETASWRQQHFFAAPNYLGALVVTGYPSMVEYWDASRAVRG